METTAQSPAYLPSRELNAFATLAHARMRRGRGAVLLLEGPPGGGKTAFAKYLARQLGAPLHYHACRPDKEADLLYEIDVQGVLRRENAWVPGPAWQAFNDSTTGTAVLLIDEADKASHGFDALLLRMLEEMQFRAPDGTTVTARPCGLAVILTSNGRREMRPEVLRRAQRVYVPLPDKARLRRIIREIAGDGLPDRLVELLIKLGESIRKEDPELAPSPKEIALCGEDLMALAEAGENDDKVWREVAVSWLVKATDGSGPATLDRLARYSWTKALRTEAGAR